LPLHKYKIDASRSNNTALNGQVKRETAFVIRYFYQKLNQETLQSFYKFGVFLL